jgi:ribonuclease VapC
MVVDTSAVLAVLFDEPEAALFAGIIEREPSPLISAVAVLEASFVVGARKRERGLAALQRLLDRGGFREVAFDRVQLRLAQVA